LYPGPDQALHDADAAVVATDWPEFRGLSADRFVASMRRPRVIDPRRFLASALQSDPRVTYIATGKPHAFSPLAPA
jgi:UDPglucose 6-dehydrogenase